jgi:hypothetical protein
MRTLTTHIGFVTMAVTAPKLDEGESVRRAWRGRTGTCELASAEYSRYLPADSLLFGSPPVALLFKLLYLAASTASAPYGA